MVAANRSRTASHGDAEKLDADQRIETQGERNPALSFCTSETRLSRMATSAYLTVIHCSKVHTVA
jgi:hypothetical protein